MKSVHPALITALLLSACSSAYYSGLEKIGIPKREVMVYRVEKARDAQQETKEQFKSALEQFTAITQFQGGDLESVYAKLNGEYENSVEQAELVKKRISDIEDVSEALFSEWETEIGQYQNASFRNSSREKLRLTKEQYRQLIAAMKNAESKLPPILAVFRDHVLFLKHNLNANAIASLKNNLGSIRSDVGGLIAAMERSINEANAFIQSMDASAR